MHQRIQAVFMAICGIFMTYTQAHAASPIGVLFGSYGDIDDVGTELRPFIRRTLTDPDVLPLPAWLRATIADAGWYLERGPIREAYAQIGGKTGMRALSQAQAEAVAQALTRRGYDARGYAGFTMTFPFVAEALARAKRDGVERLFVFYQGAQYSRDTTHILFRHVRDYLAQHPEWKVEVTGVKSFSDDERFVDLVADKIDRSLDSQFAEFSRQDVCVFLSIHGNVDRLSREGDPYMDQVMAVVRRLVSRLQDVPVNYGFHNHDEIPGVAWSQPSTHKALGATAQEPCQAVLINGDVSFTVDNLETLYHQKIEHPRRLHQEAVARRLPTKTVIVQDIFNLDQDFVEFMANLAEEASRGQGDIIPIKRLSAVTIWPADDR